MRKTRREWSSEPFQALSLLRLLASLCRLVFGVFTREHDRIGLAAAARSSGVKTAHALHTHA